MSNTKWKEVFLLLAKHKLGFKVEWLNQSETNTQGFLSYVSTDIVQERGIGDPGVGGPFSYLEIKSLNIPSQHSISEFRNNFCYRSYDLVQNIDNFKLELSNLGKLPCEFSINGIQIHGYK